ncbi:protein kinase [Streptomyces sp. NPDC093801]|uniref:protein kinase n=1 Tax=Streptomyces sp. NPDC093801 TaxID=3155203 RepID=UPI0034510102
MEDYAGRILADRYRLPLPPTDEYELVETRAFDTRSGQEVLVRHVPLPEVVDAELLDGTRATPAAAGELPAVRRAIAAAQAAASVPDHPRLDQVFDVFAEDGSLWIVSELVPARPLAALIADEPLTPYRAAEVASDVLTALRVLHAHGWTHRNITVRTVLICEDGRVVLTGLAAGAAEDALCGYDPVPAGEPWGGGPGAPAAPWEPPPPAPGGREPVYAPLVAPGYDTGPRYSDHILPEPERASEPGYEPPYGPGSGSGSAYGSGSGSGSGSAYGSGAHPEPGWSAPPDPPAAAPAPAPAPAASPGPPARPAGTRDDALAAARARTVAAYRAGSRAAAEKVAQERGTRGPVVVPQLPPTGANLPQEYAYPYGGPDTAAPTPWHGAAPRRRQETEPQPQQEAAEDPRQDRLPHPEPEPPAAPPRPALPAQLALPQGYHQADPPAPAPHPHPGDGTGEDHPSPPAFLQTPAPGAAGTPAPGAAGTPAPGAPGGPAARAPEARPPAAFAPGARPPVPPAPVPPAPVARPVPVPSAGGWGGGSGQGGGGPRTGLDAERARQTRMAVVGPVTERWAPEQAGPVHGGPWQLAAPVGPATDLWALGALLYRAVQGHAPYPEESVAELVDMVCAEPPAFAEECGALRPVVESLLRQDPTERPDFEELRGWLRSLVRSAPEPDGDFVFPLPEPDPARLPEVRRRADLHGRHRSPDAPRKPRSPVRTLLAAVLVLLAGGVAYAMLFLPGSDDRDAGRAQQPTAAQSPVPPSAAPKTQKPPQQSPSAPASSGAQPPAQQAPEGYTLQQDPAHFTIAVPNGWERQSINEAGQVRYTQGQFTLIVVPGRDRVEGGSPDPMGYQKDKEAELAPYRNSTWASGGDVKSTRVGQQLRVTGRYTWIDAAGRSLFARNFVVALGGAYHVVMVTGPEDNQDKVTDVFDKATASYQAGG